MLLQSEDPHGSPTSLTPAQSGAAAFLHLLPALPPAFPTGKVTGLRARGGIGVDLEWKDGKLVRATLRADASEPVTVRYAGREKRFSAKARQTYSFGPGL